MGFAIVDGGAAHVATGGTADTVTSGAINSTGANLLIAVPAWYVGGGTATVSDSKGNSWTPLTAYTDGAEPKVQIYYSVPTSVGSGHTAAVNGTGIYPSVAFYAFSGAHATPYDSHENGASGLGPSANPGSSGTPSVDNCLVFAAVCFGGGQSFPIASVDAPFTLGDQSAFLVDNHLMVLVAYDIQTTAAARNPGYATVAGPWGSAIAVFKPSVGGGPSDLAVELHEPVLGSTVF